MLRRCAPRRAVDAATGQTKPNLGIPEFVDPRFLANKRPSIPGGSWSKEMLAKKSFADLQQIWFILLKERNMLLSMREHYLKHMEELGAWPAPSRLKLVDQSMSNLKEVVRERDFKANERAIAIFNERLKKRIYRYPPGPQPPPGNDDPASTVRFKLSRYVSEERLKELFGRYDVFDEHKGIVSLTVRLPDEVLESKRLAEERWEEYRTAKRDFDDYQQIQSALPSDLDVHQHIELAPGVFYGAATVTKLQSLAEASAGEEIPQTKADDDAAEANVLEVVKSGAESGDIIIASKVAVPPRQQQPLLPADPIYRLRHEALPPTQRRNVQLGYFPNLTMTPPPNPGPRPQHADEIEGPWIVEVTYDRKDGFAYAKGLGINRVDGAVVSNYEDVTVTTPAADRCPIYQEAILAEEADSKHQMEWPRVPYMTPGEVRDLQVKPLFRIIADNWNNTVDYTEREALLTGKSMWDLPITVDHSCGDSRKIPPGFKPADRSVIDDLPFMFDNY